MHAHLLAYFQHHIIDKEPLNQGHRFCKFKIQNLNNEGPSFFSHVSLLLSIFWYHLNSSPLKARLMKKLAFCHPSKIVGTANNFKQPKQEAKQTKKNQTKI